MLRCVVAKARQQHASDWSTLAAWGFVSLGKCTRASPSRKRQNPNAVVPAAVLAACCTTSLCLLQHGHCASPRCHLLRLLLLLLVPLLALSLLLPLLALQGGGSATPATDVICPMYARIPQLKQLAAAAAARGDPRPIMLCEYCHSMGNSTGNIDAYWRLFVESTAAMAAGSNSSTAAAGSSGGGWSGSSVIGGFIWDWADQSLVKREAVDGKEVRAFRGLGFRVGYAFNSSLHA